MENKIYYYDVYIETTGYESVGYQPVSEESTLLAHDRYHISNWEQAYHLGVF